MKNVLRYFAFALGFLLFLAGPPDAMAQKKKKKKKAKSEVKGHDGMVKGEVPNANAERKFLMDRQQAMNQAKDNGYSTGSAYSLSKNQYETKKGRFAVSPYENRSAKKIKKKKKKKRVIDEDNPDGKLYKEGLKKRKRKFLFF